MWTIASGTSKTTEQWSTLATGTSYYKGIPSKWWEEGAGCSVGFGQPSSSFLGTTPLQVSEFSK